MENSKRRAYDNGKLLAETTTAYRMLLAQKILQLKAEGLQISIIEKVAKGDEEVAQAEFEMMEAEALYKASNENIQIMKLELKCVQADIEREYPAGKNI
jgi:hypothetical protein